MTRLKDLHYVMSKFGKSIASFGDGVFQKLDLVVNKHPSSLDANTKSCDGQNDIKNVMPTQSLELSPSSYLK